MKVVVTGGCGYLGSVLVGELLRCGHEVVAIDNLYRGVPLRPVAGLTQQHSDMRDVAQVGRHFYGADAVIHLAGIVGDKPCDEDRDETASINVKATDLIVELCKHWGVGKLIYASSCSVYGYNDGMADEDTTPNPISFYATTKLCSEAIVRQFPQHVIFRMGTLYGLSPRMRFDLVINLFIAKSIIEREIQYFGGTQWRPFIHVLDASQAYIAALGSGCVGTYNLASSNSTILLVARDIASTFRARCTEHASEHDNRNYLADTRKLESVLGKFDAHDVRFAMCEISWFHDLENYADTKYANWRP